MEAVSVSESANVGKQAIRRRINRRQRRAPTHDSLVVRCAIAINENNPVPINQGGRGRGVFWLAQGRGVFVCSAGFAIYMYVFLDLLQSAE